MVSLQSALLPAEANRRPPCLSFLDTSVVTSTATSKKRKRDGGDADDTDGIELNFDAAPLPLEWQRCLDIKSGQIHYYNTRTHKRTSKDPRRAGAAAMPAVEEEEDAGNCGPLGLDLDLNLAFEPRRASPVKEEKKARPAADQAKPAAADREDAAGGMEMVAAVCVRCHMLVMMSRACPACPNCKFLHPTGRGAASPSPAPPPPAPAPLKLGLQLLCCRDQLRYQEPDQATTISIDRSSRGA